MAGSAFAGAWHWRPDVVLALGAVAVITVRGWLALRRRGFSKLASLPRLFASLAGWAVVAFALLSPLDVFQRLFFSVHMVQHELLLVIAPPLVLLGHPLPIAFWGLPSGARVWAGRWLRRRAPLRRAFDLLSAPLAAWAVSTGILWAWHLPVAYDAVQGSTALHNAQHLSFFAAGLLFWWPVIAAPPLVRRLNLPVLCAYLIAGMLQRSLLGAIITLSNRVLYAHYGAVDGAATALRDQHVAGAIMWFGSGIVLLAITLTIIWRAPGAMPGDAGDDFAGGSADTYEDRVSLATH